MGSEQNRDLVEKWQVLLNSLFNSALTHSPPLPPASARLTLHSPISYSRPVGLKAEWIGSLFEQPALKNSPKHTHKEKH